MSSHCSLPRRVLLGRRYLGAVLLLPLAVACQGDHLVLTPPVDPAVLYWNLELNHHAVTLSTTAPYDTLTLAATPRNQAGEALVGLPEPQYRSTNPDQVVVTEHGILVGAKLTNTPVAVIATLTTANLKHEDTVLVRVMDAPTPPVLGDFSIHPVPPDSAKFGMNGGPLTRFYYLLNRLVHAADTGGTPLPTVTVGFDPFPSLQEDLLGFVPVQFPITDLLVSFRVSDATVALVDVSSGSGMQIFKLQGLRPGTVKVYASATVFGVTKADTIDFRIGLPVYARVQITTRDSIGHSRATVGAGGMVWWILRDADVTFSDPTNVAAGMTAASFLPAVDEEICGWLAVPCDVAGNIPTTPLPFLAGSGPFQSRVFPVPGTYEYQSTPAGAGGKTFRGYVIVVDER